MQNFLLTKKGVNKDKVALTQSKNMEFLVHCTTDVVSAENCTITLVKPSTGAQGSRLVPSQS